MCSCTPSIRTPFCGKPGCVWPEQKKSAVEWVLKVREAQQRHERITAQIIDAYVKSPEFKAKYVPRAKVETEVIGPAGQHSVFCPVTHGNTACTCEYKESNYIRQYQLNRLKEL